MVGAGMATATLRARFADAQAEQPDLRSLIDGERKRIAETMDRHDVPGLAVCLIHEGQPGWIEGFCVTGRRSNLSLPRTCTRQVLMATW